MSVITSLLSLAIFVMCLVAGIVPTWITDTPSSFVMGPYRMCVGNDDNCIARESTILQTSFAGCTPDTDAFKARMRTTLAFSWIAWIVGFFALILAICCRLRAWSLNAVCVPISFLTGFGSICAMIALAVFGSTRTQFLGCGREICEYYTGTFRDCGYGGSFGVEIVACVSGLFVIIFACMGGLCFRNMTAGADLTIFGLLVYNFSAIIAASTNRWLIASNGNTNSGLFWSCDTDNKCDKSIPPAILDADTPFFCPGTTEQFGTAKQLRARFDAVAAMVFIAAILALITAVIACFSTLSRAIVGGLFVFIAIFIFIGLIVFSHTVNRWLTCGQKEWCSQLSGTNLCGFGFSFALATASLILAGLLAIFSFLECCGVPCCLPANDQVWPDNDKPNEPTK